MKKRKIEIPLWTFWLVSFLLFIFSAGQADRPYGFIQSLFYFLHVFFGLSTLYFFFRWLYEAWKKHERAYDLALVLTLPLIVFLNIWTFYFPGSFAYVEGSFDYLGESFSYIGWFLGEGISLVLWPLALSRRRRFGHKDRWARIWLCLTCLAIVYFLFKRRILALFGHTLPSCLGPCLMLPYYE